MFFYVPEENVRKKTIHICININNFIHLSHSLQIDRNQQKIKLQIQTTAYNILENFFFLYIKAICSVNYIYL